MWDSSLFCPSNDMNFGAIKDSKNVIKVEWTHNYFEDYKQLSLHYFECGHKTFKDIAESDHNKIKSDMWFLTGVFLICQSIELGLKALLCRNYKKNLDIQKAFKKCCHDVSALFQNYCNIGNEDYLTILEKDWLEKYLKSLEEVDKKSDMFRFPFEDEFLSKYNNKILDNVKVGNNLIMAYALIDKCLEKGMGDNIRFEDFSPTFFVFASNGDGNCYLWEGISGDGFDIKIRGYRDVIDYIYNCEKIPNKNKLYPLMFMLRNTIELSLKRLFYSRIDNGVPKEMFFSKRKSHLIKKDLWGNIKKFILEYVVDNANDIDVVERLLFDIDELDKKGDIFRYPTSYSLEYRFDNKIVDVGNIYEILCSIINCLDGYRETLDEIVEYEEERQTEYEADMESNMEWE